jgi:ribosome-associated protein
MIKTARSKPHPSFQLARLAAKAADQKLGRDILLLDVRSQSSVTDCFVFVSGTSHVHVRALEDAIREAMRESGANLLRTDGQRGNVWRVLDYGSILIHIMDNKTREYYSVERLWDQAKKISAPAAKPVKRRSVKKK